MAEAKKVVKKGEAQPSAKAETASPKAVKAPKAPKEPKAPAEPKEPKAPQLTPNKMCRNLLLERSMTDEQIFTKIKEVFPDSKFTQAYISTTRIDLNKGYYKAVAEETKGNPILRLVEVEGKLVSADDFMLQKKEDKKRAKEERIRLRAEKAAAAKKAAEDKKAKAVKTAEVPEAPQAPKATPVKKSIPKAKKAK